MSLEDIPVGKEPSAEYLDQDQALQLALNSYDSDPSSVNASLSGAAMSGLEAVEQPAPLDDDDTKIELPQKYELHWAIQQLGEGITRLRAHAASADATSSITTPRKEEYRRTA